jgi:gluconolactonase
VVADTLEERPNGLCFSPDETKLYISDTGIPKNVRVFDMQGSKLIHERIFAEITPGAADGMRRDVHGHLWTRADWGGSGYDGVHCLPQAGL